MKDSLYVAALLVMFFIGLIYQNTRERGQPCRCQNCPCKVAK